MLRVVADVNTYVSAVISPQGPTGQILEAAQQGYISLIVNEALCDELEEVLARNKFRRWITEDQAEDYVAAIKLMAEWAPDRPVDQLPQVCSDPDDNYLIALCEDSAALILVSGDTAVQKVQHPDITIYTASQMVKAIEFALESGSSALVPGEFQASVQHIEAAGNAALIRAYSSFSVIFSEAEDKKQAADLLRFVVVPSAHQSFVDAFEEVRADLAKRGLVPNPTYVAPDVAYLRLPPSPSQSFLVTEPVMLPPNTIHVTMLRCADLPDMPGVELDHWRVFKLGEPVPPEEIAPPHQ